MINFEKYKNEVLRILEVSECEIPGAKNGILTICNSMPCNECDFHGDDINCVHEFIKWLYEDDGEEPDGCDGCKYEYKREDESPCTECCNNYTSKWKYKPKKKRQDNLLKIFPDATISGLTKASVICPVDISKNVECRGKGDENCRDCKREYWLEKVKE